jgi:alkylation response protein AidB-like acyl-CoA dehydrogenase
MGFHDPYDRYDLVSCCSCDFTPNGSCAGSTTKTCMSIAVEAGKALVYRAAGILKQAERDPGRLLDATTAIYQAKVLASKAVVDNGSLLFQVCGARAVARSFNADRFWRNGRTLTLHDVVDKQRETIGKNLLAVPLEDAGIYTIE